MSAAAENGASSAQTCAIESVSAGLLMKSLSSRMVIMASRTAERMEGLERGAQGSNTASGREIESRRGQPAALVPRCQEGI